MADNKHTSFYQYDAAGERTYKLTGQRQRQVVNGQNYSYATLNTPTLYASAYLVATPKGYTKHYYAESERIASKIGGGGLAMLNALPIEDSYKLFKQKHSKNYTQFKQTLECLEANAEVVSNVLSPLYEFREILSTEPDCYWYHPDHLGSGSWITFTDGDAVQHLHYLPWGESMVDQRVSGFSSLYTFSAKEKDTETGYSYFGARYYSSDLSIWLSVDPMSDKYPSLSAYTYCANNPIKLVDPNGEEWVDANGNPVKDHSKIKIYIFYDSRGDGEGFAEQTKKMVSVYEKQYGKGSVALSNVTTMEEFSQDWGDMASPNIKEVNLNYHGNNQTLYLNTANNQYITATGNNTTNKGTKNVMNVQDLPSPSGNISRAQLNINSCKSASSTQSKLQGSEKLTLARAFSKYFDFGLVRATAGGVSYRSNGFPRPQPHRFLGLL